MCPRKSNSKLCQFCYNYLGSIQVEGRWICDKCLRSGKYAPITEKQAEALLPTPAPAPATPPVYDGDYVSLAKAFMIFAKYEGPQNVAAEHDKIFAGPNPEAMTVEDINALHSLQWYPDNDLECFYYFT